MQALVYSDFFSPSDFGLASDFGIRISSLRLRSYFPSASASAAKQDGGSDSFGKYFPFIAK
jgi:hypothetical protein